MNNSLSIVSLKNTRKRFQQPALFCQSAPESQFSKWIRNKDQWKDESLEEQCGRMLSEGGEKQ